MGTTPVRGKRARSQPRPARRPPSPRPVVAGGHRPQASRGVARPQSPPLSPALQQVRPMLRPQSKALPPASPQAPPLGTRYLRLRKPAPRFYLSGPAPRPRLPGPAPSACCSAGPPPGRAPRPRPLRLFHAPRSWPHPSNRNCAVLSSRPHPQVPAPLLRLRLRRPAPRALPTMVNLGLSRVDDAVAARHPVRKPVWDAGLRSQKLT